MFDYKQFYRRKLPHRHSPGGTLFITFRLAGSIPKALITQYKNEKFWLDNEIKRVEKLSALETDVSHNVSIHDLQLFYRNWFQKFEDILHKEVSGPVWLKNPKVADLVADGLKHRDGRDYKLKAFCIMANHVHVVFTPLLSTNSLKEVKGSNPLRFESIKPTLGAIMQSLKGYTARKANRILLRDGQFWESESYDHEVRNDEELARIIRYVLNNPVKAGLVKNWGEWKWNWVASGFDQM